MSQEEQLNKMRLEIHGDLTDDTQEEVFKLKLDDAEIVALSVLFPYDYEQQELDKQNKRLVNWQTRCAIELYAKMGNTNVSQYSENGLSVSYMTGLISKELMAELIPRAGVIK